MAKWQKTDDISANIPKGMIFRRWGSLNEQCRKGCRYLSDVIPMQIFTFDGGRGFADLPDQSLFGWSADPSRRILPIFRSISTQKSPLVARTRLETSRRQRKISKYKYKVLAKI